MTETGPTPADGEIVRVWTCTQDADGGMDPHVETAVYIDPHAEEDDHDDD